MRLKLLRDLKGCDEDTPFRCYDEDLAKKFGKDIPFLCYSVVWAGGGLVRISFFVDGEQYSYRDFTFISNLEKF